MLDDHSTMRLYAAVIGIVSGTYSLTGPKAMMGATPFLAALIGLVALSHGILLLTPYANRLGQYNGPLMVAYAAGMLFTSYAAWMRPMMGVDRGMIALAALMLFSGLLMMDRHQSM